MLCGADVDLSGTLLTNSVPLSVIAADGSMAEIYTFNRGVGGDAVLSWVDEVIST
jgi:hypothetical protein